MDKLKKITVLFTGFSLVVLMSWILSITGKPLKPISSDNYRPIPENSSRGTLDGTSQFRSMEDAATNTSETDTIEWVTATEIEKTGKLPQIAGKLPPFTDPNRTFVNAAKKILPAVVSIHSARKVRSSMGLLPFLKEDEEDEEDDGHYQPGSGSGIIVSKDGYIMTNYHVVEDARELTVVLYDKREFGAELVGGDPTTDIAVLQIKDEDLPPAFIGNSDSVSVGEWVMAVGNPLNFTSTVTTGIVSALGRDIDIIDNSYRYKIENFIQTDAVINPGNSGGALVNLKGEVVGINTAIATRSGYYQGYGFAIPINLAKKVVNDILRFGRVRRAILGVVIEQVTSEVAKAMGLSRPAGALIQSAGSDTPASQAGLRQGDIILAVNDRNIESVNDLQIKIAQHHPGEVVRLLVWRDKKKWEVKVELGEAPASSVPAIQGNNSHQESYDHFGMELRPLSENEKSEYLAENGLWINGVSLGSPADKAGVRPETILIDINNHPVLTLSGFEQLTDDLPSGKILRLKVKEGNFDDGSDIRILFLEIP